MTDLLPGLSARAVPTPRLEINVLEVDGRDGVPLILVHGNVSSNLFWQRLMLDLPDGVRPIALDLRGFGDTEAAPIDATRGVRDHSDDLGALLDALGLESAHLLGWSMGGGVVLQLLRDSPGRVRSATLVNPVSPYGFGGTRGAGGELCHPDGAGSGGGAANPEFVQRLAAGDRSDEAPVSPRNVMRALYVAGGDLGELEDVYVESMLSTHIGDDHYPGDATDSPHWPGTAPGTHGVLNSFAPTHFRIGDLAAVDPKPPIRWIRGSADAIISDTSALDLAYLGSLGVVPGWPGVDECPPQPMIAQTRAVLDSYAAAGGEYREVVIEGAGHSPHLERPAEFRAALPDPLLP